MWTANSFTSDQSSQMTVTSTPLTGNEWIGPVVRAQNGGQNLYVGIYFWNSGSPELMLFKRIGGGWTQLGSPYQSGAPVAGTQLELTAVGSSLQFSENGVVEITASDTSLTAGAPGIMANGGATGGSWSGGSVVGTESIGGSVSGLSGTVALQDNGGDTLSVSANGSFTFATLLAPGQAYNVTVATNPSGQVCTVSNGSGTVASSNVTNVTVSCAAQSSGSGSARVRRRRTRSPERTGVSGANWTDMTDGGLAISSQVVVGTAVGNSGDMWTANSFTSNQYSQVAVTSTPLTGNQWIGPVVRAQNGGQSLYVGIYFWNSGSPELMLFKRIGGGWTQLGSPYQSGALVAGTQLELTAVGSSLSVLGERGGGDHRQRHQPDRRGAGHHGQRRRRPAAAGRAGASWGRSRSAAPCRGCRARWPCRTTVATR